MVVSASGDTKGRRRTIGLVPNTMVRSGIVCGQPQLQGVWPRLRQGLQSLRPLACA